MTEVLNPLTGTVPARKIPLLTGMHKKVRGSRNSICVPGKT